MNKALYIDELIVKSKTSLDDFGQTIGTQKPIKGFLQKVSKLITKGNQSQSVSMNLFNTDDLLDKSDIIIMDGSEYEIKEIETIKNHFTGLVDHYEVLF